MPEVEIINHDPRITFLKSEYDRFLKIDSLSFRYGFLLVFDNGGGSVDDLLYSVKLKSITGFGKHKMALYGLYRFAIKLFIKNRDPEIIYCGSDLKRMGEMITQIITEAEKMEAKHEL